LEPRPGSGDLWLWTDARIPEWQDHVSRKGVSLELGPVPRSGARGRIESLYLRDPDDNLIEIARYEGAAAAE